jgi:hypothetical protein
VRESGGEGRVGEWGGREGMKEGGKMTQTLYAHMNKIKIKKKRIPKYHRLLALACNFPE